MEALSVLNGQIKLVLLVIAGLAIILGFRRQGMKVFQHVIVMAFLSPFIISFINQLPMWIVIPGLLIIAGTLFRKAVGEEVWGQFFGGILYDVLWRLPLRIFGAIGRGIRNIFHQMVD